MSPQWDVNGLNGEYYHNMDEKGRLFLPVKLRAEIGDTFYVTKGLDGCLFVYSEDNWKILEDRLRALPMSKSRNLQRFFLSGAAECTADKNGRFLIPQSLREYAALEKEVCIAGVTDRAEIWNAEKWRALNAELCADTEAMARAMEEMGF